MPGTKRIYDNTVTPNLWLTSWDPSTGEVTGTSTDVDAPCNDNASFSTNVARNAAITLINSYSGNSFIGHVPPPPH